MADKGASNLVIRSIALRRNGIQKCVGHRVIFSFLLLSCSFFCVGGEPKDNAAPIPQPNGLRYDISTTDSPMHILNAFLGIPYRVDGATNERGNYVLFSRPETILDKPGLNCSGFVLSASRFLLNKNITLSAASLDRLGDSGPTADYGEDWDFGWDLILNIAQGVRAEFLLPGGVSIEASDADISGISPRGYDLHAAETWAELSQRLKPGFLYLLSFNKDSRNKRYKMQHYHVGLIYVDDKNNVWLYQTTGRSKKIYRRNLSDKGQRALFLKSFANSGGIKKYLLVLQIALPIREQ